MKLFDTEVREQVGVLIGDVHTEVRISYRPMAPPSTTKENITLDMINTRLQMLGGVLQHKIEEMVREAIESNTING